MKMKVELPADWSDDVKDLTKGIATVSLAALMLASVALLFGLIAMFGGKSNAH
jgi:hypothetical protein